MFWLKHKNFINSLVLFNFVIVIESNIETNIFNNLRVDPKIYFSNGLLKEIKISLPINKTIVINSISNSSVVFVKNVEILDKNCLFSGQITLDKEVVGSAILSVCSNDSQMVCN